MSLIFLSAVKLKNQIFKKKGCFWTFRSNFIILLHSSNHTEEVSLFEYSSINFLLTLHLPQNWNFFQLSSRPNIYSTTLYDCVNISRRFRIHQHDMNHLLIRFRSSISPTLSPNRHIPKNDKNLLPCSNYLIWIF